ncbi:MAG: porphobilinogen synthase, partial [Candidatus Puniceispirillales bacterium]
MKQPTNKLFSLNSFPRIRMRRNRMSKFSRRLITENNLSLDDLIYPIFITYGSNVKEEVASMPGIYRFSLDLLHKEIEYISSLGIPA